jgi:NAD(P)-dependent dehydrogenase (short-subunit alcohol dehydrogenase family)
MADQNSSDWLGLSGRVAAITGGGGGIGRATAVSFAKAGAKVAVIDRDEKGLETTRGELRALGTDPVVVPCDTTDEKSVTAAAETVEKSLGACSILVNTAAILRSGGLDTLSLAEWNTTMAVNLTGYFLCAQMFGRQMRERGAGAWCMWPRSRRQTRRAFPAPTASARPASSCCRGSLPANGARTAFAAMW